MNIKSIGMKRMNKKGWLRIVEAFLAILIVVSAVLIVMSKDQTRVDLSGDVNYKQRQILDIIAKNDSLRESILQNETAQLNSQILLMAPKNWNFTTKICDIKEVCTANIPLDREVYVSQIIITSSINEYDPKKIKFFTWRK
ncbi:MAG: hypothetical protein WC979_08275 [Candidatus Pacearchaeota archaeon]